MTDVIIEIKGLASQLSDHILYSYVRNVWFRYGIIRKNLKLVFLRDQKVKNEEEYQMKIPTSPFCNDRKRPRMQL